MATRRELLLVVLVAALSVASAVALDDFDFVNYWVQKTEAEQQSVSVDDATVSVSAIPPRGRTIVVDQKGHGDYKTVQKAIDSVPTGNTKRIIIYIKNGVYREKIRITKDKAWIYMKCQSKNAILTYGDTAAKAGGTSLSASTAIEADGFIASDCTFANSAPPPPGGAIGKQAVALRIQGDKGAFYRCAFLGAQDTLYDKQGRHFFRSCYIRGSIDWIFGDGQSFYQTCNIRSIAENNSGSITAQKRDTNSKTGFVFYRCQFSGSGTIYLGRAWGTHSRVIFYQCHFANAILPIGWMDWADPKRQKTVYYAEYKCTGIGANRKGRAKWSRELTDREARAFGTTAFIDGKSWFEPRM